MTKPLTILCALCCGLLFTLSACEREPSVLTKGVVLYEGTVTDGELSLYGDPYFLPEGTEYEVVSQSLRNHVQLRVLSGSSEGKIGYITRSEYDDQL